LALSLGKPWDAAKCIGPQSPFNPVTNHIYRGINVLILGMDITAFRTGDPRFCTYKQAQEKGWQVKGGSKSRTIFYTKSYDVKDEDEDDGKKSIRFLKHFSVFPAADIEGIPPYVPPTTEEAPWQSDEATDIIMKNSGVVERV
jgi:antirestriction protein ArdC